MKKVWLLPIILLLNFSAPAQCPTGQVNLVTQADVVTFATTYPGCTTIAGNLNIGDPANPGISNITNLSSLSGITRVEGTLNIAGNRLLTNLTGLHNITKAGSLTVNYNDILVSLEKLTKLTPIDNSLFQLEINRDDNLQNLTGLEGLTSVKSVSLNNNSALDNLLGLSNLNSISDGFILFGNGVTSLEGLEALTYIGGASISTNTKLKDLKGLSNLITARDGMMFQDNDILVDLSGLEKLTNVAGIIIGMHNALTSLKGLSNVAVSSLRQLVLIQNPLLSMCAVKTVCEAITSPDALVLFQNNAPGCNSAAEVQLACQALPVTLANFAVTTEGNAAKLDWSTTEEVNSDHFEVQMSTDAKTWRSLGTVTSNGDSKQQKQYTFTDALPTKPISYYRLKMVDRDGTFALSPIRSLIFEALALRLYPNPAVETAYLDGEDLQNIKRVVLTNGSGKVISEWKAVTTDGFSLKRIAPGLYFLKVYRNNGSLLTFKVVKM